MNSYDLYSNHSSLHVHIWSCYADLASKDINSLAKNSVLVTYGLADFPSSGSMHSLASEQILINNTLSNPFEAFLCTLHFSSLQTSIFNVSQEAEPPFQFVLKPSLKEVLNNAHKVLLEARVDFINFYNKIRYLDNNLKKRFIKDLHIEELSEQELKEFVSGYFIHKCHIGSSEVIELLESNYIPELQLSRLINYELYCAAPLLVAAQNGHLEIVRILLNKGAEINLSNNDRYTALHLAASEKRHKILILLLNKGADINMANKNGETALILAVYRGAGVEIIETLIDCGAEVNRVNNYGDGPLSVALYLGYGAYLNLLLLKGADVNKANIYGQTPLFRQASIGNDYFIIELINNGADVNIVDINGETPIFIAVRKNQFMVVKILLANGADINLVNIEGMTPIIYAICLDNFNIAQILIEHSPQLLRIKSKESMYTINGISKLCPTKLNVYQDLVKEIINMP